MKDSLIIISARKVKMENVSEFATKSWYIQVELMKDTGDDARIGGRSDTKVILHGNKNTSRIFDKIDKVMKDAYPKGADGKYPKEWRVWSKEETKSKDENIGKFAELPTPIKTFGYMAKHILPEGTVIVRQTKAGKREYNSLDVTCFGETDTFDKNGNLTDHAWGETPRGIYEQMASRGMFDLRVVATSNSANASDFDVEDSTTPVSEDD